MPNDNSMSERILRNIELLIENDHNLKDFCIVPTPDTNEKNKSPILLHEDNTIGLESWCVKHIYHYAHDALLDARLLLRARKLPLQRMRDLNHLLVGALLINPDVYTFWNMKRELVEELVLNVEKELLFAKLVLSRKGKSNEAFSYRRWLVERRLGKVGGLEAMNERFIEGELEVAEMAAEKCVNNYHAWNHRIWVLGRLIKEGELRDVLGDEVEFSWKFICLHVSEHVGFHYRLTLIKLIKDNRIVLNNFSNVFVNDVDQYLKSCLDVSYKAILEDFFKNSKDSFHLNFVVLILNDLFKMIIALENWFPDHEVMWCYRRGLIYYFLQSIYEFSGIQWQPNTSLDDICAPSGANFLEKLIKDSDAGESKPKVFKYELNQVESSLLYKVVLWHEKMIVRSKVQSGSSELAKVYATRYELWLKNLFEYYED